MTIAFAPSPWSMAPAAQPAAGWRFGRVLQTGGSVALQWLFKRNCSVTPRQVLGFYLSLSLVSVLVAVGFWLQGARLVGLFTGLELVAVGLALMIFSRHAADRETITLAGHALAVEHRFGHATARADFRVEWVRVEPSAGEGSLVELSGQGQRAEVGRYIRPELRAELAQELRLALQRARHSAPVTGAQSPSEE